MQGFQYVSAQLIWGVCLMGSVMLSAGSESVRAETPRKVEYAIVLHGGAGRLPSGEESRQAREETMQKALEVGQKMLAEGRSSLETVEAVVKILEDAPSINSGRGAVFNAAGTHELDAAIMDGKTRACGAVGGVTTVKHPISLARLVMTETPHILLAGPGAEQFADDVGAAHGIERVPNEYFSTESRRKELERVQAAENKPSGMGTCGCVALDRDGNLAAATSTGGLTNKRFGRLGDTPIIAAGTYADNRTCAVSCTGTGEDFIRYAVAYDIAARMRYGHESLEQATQAVLNDPDQVVRGGLIAIDHNGTIAMPFNTAGMSRAAADSTGRWEVKIGK